MKRLPSSKTEALLPRTFTNFVNMRDEYEITTHQAIARTNQRLRQENIGLKNYLRGQRLYLRGSLPPKAHSSRDKPHQQDLALGYRANPAGLLAAYKKAKLIEAQVVNKT